MMLKIVKDHNICKNVVVFCGYHRKFFIWWYIPDSLNPSYDECMRVTRAYLTRKRKKNETMWIGNPDA